MTTIHELVPGLLLALADDRDADAIELARAIAEDLATPELAAIHVGLAANLLHKQPQIALRDLAKALRNGGVFEDAAPGDLSDQLLTVLADGLTGDGRSPATRHLLADVECRSGSSYVLEQLLRVVEAVLGEMTLRTALALADPSKAVEIQNAALSRVRAAIADGRGPDA
jgi:hypothetical protein